MVSVVPYAVSVVAVEGSDKFALEKEACVYRQLQLEFAEEENEPYLCVAESVVGLVVDFRSLVVINQSRMNRSLEWELLL